MIYKNEEHLNKIKLEKDNFYVLADFDRTITSGDGESTWGLISKSKYMDDAYKQERQKLFELYRPIEIDCSIDYDTKNEHMINWWKSHINLLLKYNLNENVIKDIIDKNYLKFRQGAKEFLKSMYEQNVPVIIISAGIGNIINEFLISQNANYENIHIISNFIDFKEGKINKFNNYIIHSLNKNMTILPDNLKQELSNRKNILLLGDGLDDIRMCTQEKRKDTIAVGFLEEKIEENLSSFRKLYDIIFTENRYI